MKKSSASTLILGVIIILMLSACGNTDAYEIRNTAGEKITVPAENLTKEQKSALKEVVDGKTSVMAMIRSGVFSEEEMRKLDIDSAPARRPMQSSLSGNGAPPADGFAMDFSSVQYADLNTEGLSDEKIERIKGILDGSQDIRTILRDGILSMEELQSIGLMEGINATEQGGMARGGMQIDLSTIKFEELNTEGLTEEQIALVKAILSGEKDFRDLMNSGMSREQIQQLGLTPQRQGGEGGA